MTESQEMPQLPARITPMEMLHHAVTSGASIEVLEKLMGLHERWDATQARKAFDAAMADARAELPVIAKNRTVQFETKRGDGKTSYQHEDMAEIARSIDAILGKHGLSYRFDTDTGPNKPVTVTCIVSHRDGHSVRNSLSAGLDTSGSKNSIQALGSAITYLQRYALKAALGLAAGVDDDAQSIPAPPRTPKPPAPNVMLHDPETGEIQTATPTAPGAADAAPGLDAPSSSPGAAPVSELDVNEADEYLAAAAAKGMDALRAAWSELSNLQQQALKAALERRHKPTAMRN